MNYLNLWIEMNAKGISKEKLAEILHISEQLLRDKLNGLIPFESSEQKLLIQLFPHCKPSYLFAQTN